MQKQPFQLPFSLIKFETPIPLKLKAQQVLSKELPEGKASLRDILNVLLPPRKFVLEQERKNVTYIQYVDQNRLSRDDADKLKQIVEDCLKTRKAKDKPLCPIRQKIFAQLLDEIIRQVVIDCPERGIMLSRVKNESFLTIAAYRTLYEESIKFSKQKLVESQNNLTQLQTTKEELLQKQLELKQRQNYLLSKKQSLQQKAREVKTIYKEKREHQIKGMMFQYEGLQTFLQEIHKTRKEEARKLKKQASIRQQAQSNPTSSDSD